MTASRRFQAVVLDLFDTLVRWQPDSLPAMEIRGREVRTTLPLLAPELARTFGPSFGLERFVDVYRDVMEEVARARESDQIEITCEERFRRALDRLGLARGDSLDRAARRLKRLHMAAVRSVTAAPPERVAVVRRIAPYYRLGLLSNFDDAETGRAIVADTGVADLFEVVVISAEVGLRKPHPGIFRLVLERLGLAPSRVLFVGDTPHEDVAGADRAGIPVAWLADGKGPLPADVAPPEFVLHDFAALPAILDLE